MATRESESVAGELKQRMRGPVLVRGDSDYDEARKVWNGDIDRRPAIIARCAAVEDGKAAVACARARGMTLAVRAGGHSLPGHSVADGALMLDLRAMNQVTVDAAARRAVVQGGALWSDVDAATQPHGLAVTGGHVTHTGVAGLTLGGGIGHLMRKLGLVVDNLLSAQIVTADGRVLRASATENEDLFWAIRGGGGNFGIATEVGFKLAPPGTTTYLKAHYVNELSDDLIRAVHAETAKMPPGRSQVFVIQMGGAVSRVPEDATAVGGRSAAFQTLFIGIWDELAGRPAAMQWVRGIWSALEPFAHGAYVNLSDEQDEPALRTTYGAEKYAKLQRPKAKYDPDKVFTP